VVTTAGRSPLKAGRVEFGTRIMTGADGGAKLLFSDGSEVEVREKSDLRLVEEKMGDRMFSGVALTRGALRARWGSRSLFVRTGAYLVTGTIGLDVEVRVDESGRLHVFAIDGVAVISLGRSGAYVTVPTDCAVTISFDDIKKQYVVETDSHSETKAVIHTSDKKKIDVDIGAEEVVDNEGRVPPPPPPPETKLNIPDKPALPEDEPYEEAGEAKEASTVSPRKP